MADTLTTRFYAPTIPYTVEDALRRAVSIVSVSGRAGHIFRPGDFPGHLVRVDWDPAARGYTVGFHQCVAGSHAATDLTAALREALDYYALGIPGSSIAVTVREEDTGHPLLGGPPWSREPEEKPWYTWKHAEALRAVRLGHVARLREAPSEDAYHRWVREWDPESDPQKGRIRIYEP